MKSKKAIATGWEVVIGIALVIFSALLLIYLVKIQTDKVDESLQKQACRITNEVRFGLQQYTGKVMASPRVCNTLDKTEKGLQVPTKKYTQNKDGSTTEIRDMIKDCWYMWLEGAESNMFNRLPGSGQLTSEACFICYNFKVKGGADKISYKDITKKMEEPYYVMVSDKACSSAGGFWKDTCLKGEKPIPTNKAKPFENALCCIKEGNNACVNNGGTCSGSSAAGVPYNQWSCPNRGESCYVEQKNYFSYTKYIREFSKKGGDLVFLTQTQGASDANFVENEVYSVSFVSPSNQFCQKDGATCYAMVGGYAIAGGALILVGAKVAAGTSVIIGLLGGTFAAADQTLFGGRIANWAINSLAEKGGVASEVPNFIMVSTNAQAQKLGCTTVYGVSE